MKRSLRAVSLTLLLCAVGAAQRDPPKWATFASPEGRFEILMPGEVKQFTVDVDNEFGTSVLHMNVATLPDGTMFVANWVDYPPDAVADFPAQILDDSREGALDNLGGKLVSEKEIKLNNHRGREILIEVAKQDRLFRVRMYLVENRLYQTVVFGPPKLVKSKDAQRYLDSFELTER
jgi:hypothetical protein